MIRRYQNIIMAVISALAVIIAAYIGIIPFLSPGKPNDAGNFSYAVRVQNKDNRQNIPDAQVVVDTANKAPLNAVTDSDGFARFVVNSEYRGQAARLTIIADGYGIYTQNIDLDPNKLPDTVRLQPLAIVVVPTITPIPAPTITPIPAPTITPIPAPTLPPASVLTPATSVPASLSVNVCGERAFADGTLVTDSPIFLRPNGYSSGWVSSDASNIVLPNGTTDSIPDRYVLVVQDLPEVRLANTKIGNVYGCWYRSDMSTEQVISEAVKVNATQQAEAPNTLSVLYKVSNSEFGPLK